MNTKNKKLENISIIVIAILMILLALIKTSSIFFNRNEITINSINQSAREITYLFVLLFIQIMLYTIIYIYFNYNNSSIHVAVKKKKINKIVIIVLTIVISSFFFLIINISLHFVLNSNTSLFESFLNLNAMISGLFTFSYLLLGIFWIIITNLKKL